MRLAVVAGPATTGKTAVLRQVVRRLLDRGIPPAFLKIDVQYADEDETLAAEFGIPTRWCSPTPVVTMALPPVFFHRVSMTYCGRSGPSGSCL